MSLILARIDDRLIHGQVTVGWSRILQPDQIVLCNDTIAADSWQSRIYKSAVPPEIEVSILDKESTADFLNNLPLEHKTILLVENPEDMFDLVRRGVKIDEVNAGGMHHSNNKYEMFEYVYVNRADIAYLRRILNSGITINAQSVPGVKVHTIDMLALDAIESTMP